MTSLLKLSEIEARVLRKSAQEFAALAATHGPLAPGFFDPFIVVSTDDDDVRVEFGPELLTGAIEHAKCKGLECKGHPFQLVPEALDAVEQVARGSGAACVAQVAVGRMFAVPKALMRAGKSLDELAQSAENRVDADQIVLMVVIQPRPDTGASAHALTLPIDAETGAIENRPAAIRLISLEVGNVMPGSVVGLRWWPTPPERLN